ncbi:hypothetical protein Ahy_A01g004522 [Arachis hypogaea]|uniref:Uncharacterized protein n=1 Tax=Arachis hypogaea TaxID=3818 RepID=A0A445EWB7_ARAHY|nr:hypothetical protein Ahy_A01g004522 [Arachis hypogaea]
MLEDIRVYLMKRWTENRIPIEKYKDEILSRIKLKLQKEIDTSRCDSSTTEYQLGGLRRKEQEGRVKNHKAQAHLGSGYNKNALVV